jgi:hypothetical protein
LVTVKKKKNIQTSECHPSLLLSDLQLNRVQRLSVANFKTLLNSSREGRKQKKILNLSATHNWFTVQDNCFSKENLVVAKPFFLNIVCENKNRKIKPNWSQSVETY